MIARDRLACDAGDRLASAGLGLSTIADLLGADGSERHLTHADQLGLAHAVRALAELVKCDGYDLAAAFDPEALPAAQQAVEDLDAALAAATASSEHAMRGMTQ